MSEGRLTNVWVWKPEPGLQWRCYEGVSGIVVDAESKEAAIDHFNQIWNFKSPIEWKYQAPPRPMQHQPTAAIDPADRSHAAVVYRSLMKRYHGDVHPGATYTSDQIVSAINELWLAMRTKA